MFSFSAHPKLYAMAAAVALASLGHSGTAAAAASGPMTDLRVTAMTSKAKHATTPGAVYISFLVDGAWTTDDVFFTGSPYGAEETASFQLAGTPTRVKFSSSKADGSATNSDAWGFWKLTVGDQVVVEDPNGEAGTAYPTSKGGAGSEWWIDGNQFAPRFAEFDLDLDLDIAAESQAGMAVAKASFISLPPAAADGSSASSSGGAKVCRWRTELPGAPIGKGSFSIAMHLDFDGAEVIDKDASRKPIALSGSNNPNAKNLPACTGECDSDAQCAAGLKCFQRDNGEAIPGCKGAGGGKDWDYCYDPSALAGSPAAAAAAPMTKRQWLLNFGQRTSGSQHWLWNPQRGADHVQVGTWGANQIQRVANFSDARTLATTYDATTSMLTLYVNGAAMATKAVPAQNIKTSELLVGDGTHYPPANDESFRGCVHELRVYRDQVLTAEEVKATHRNLIGVDSAAGGCSSAALAAKQQAALKALETTAEAVAATMKQTVALIKEADNDADALEQEIAALDAAIKAKGC